MSIYLVTGNKNKAQEIKTFVPNLEVLDIDLPEIQEVDSKKVIEKKLLTAQEHTDGALIVEDTSLTLDCLNGLPGPLIKWFQQTIGNIGIYEIADHYRNYGAQAKVSIGLYMEGQPITYFEGTLSGKIVSPRGKNGFGWDDIFQPEGHELTFAEMSQDEKNSLSMRRMAAMKLESFLKNKK